MRMRIIGLVAMAAILLPVASMSANQTIDAETGRVEYKSDRDIAAMEALLHRQSTKGAGIHAQVVGNVDFQSFPAVRIFTVVTDDSGDHKPGIPQGNFAVTESRQGSTQPVGGLSVTELGPGSFSKADIVFVIDESGSMSDEIAAVRQGVKDFADLMAGSGVDYRLGIVSYEGAGYGGIGLGFSSDTLTDDVDTFKGWVDQIATQGGTERAYDAVVYACSPPFYYRGDAQQIICLVTDEPNESGRYTVLDAADALFGRQFVFFNTGSSSSVDSDFTPLGTKLGGAFSAQTLLNALGSLIVEKYMVEYTSPWPDIDMVLRDVRIEVTDPGNPADSAVATTQYTPMRGGELTGTVTDQSNGSPIENATVQAFGGPSATTDASGDYSLPGLIAAPGHSLIVDAENYRRTIVRGVTVNAGQNPPVNIEMVQELGPSIVRLLTEVNSLAGGVPTVEEGGTLMRWYRGKDEATGNQARPNVEVSVFRNNLSVKGTWEQVPQPPADSRPGTSLQKLMGDFPVKASVGSANAGDTVQFKVFYPAIAAYSDAVQPLETFECEVVDRDYVHGFENKHAASLGLLIENLSASFEDARQLRYRKSTALAAHRNLLISKYYAKSIRASIGAGGGASLSVNGHHFGAKAEADAGVTAGMFVENGYEYSDQSVASAIAKLFLYYNTKNEFDTYTVILLDYLRSQLDPASQIDAPWVYSSSGSSISGNAGAEATAGAGFIGGDVNISGALYGELSTGALPRDGRTFLEGEVGAGWSGGANAMVQNLQPYVSASSEGVLLSSIGLAADASRSDTVFARATFYSDELRVAFGRRTKAGASYNANFYDWSTGDSIAINEKLVSEFTITGNQANLEQFLRDHHGVLAGLLAGQNVLVTGSAAVDLLEAIVDAYQHPLLDVVYERRVSAYDEISANDVSLSISAGLVAKFGVSGAYSDEYNRLTEFVSERGVWYGGSLYVFEDYNADARYHLTGQGSSVIPVNAANVSDVDDGPQDWINTIGAALEQLFTQIVENIQAGIETVIQYGDSIITIGADALAGVVDEFGNAITEITVTITDALDWLNPFTKGPLDGPFFGIGGFYVMEPDGAVLQTPSTLELAYTDDEIVGWDESTLAVYRYDKGTEEWVYVGGVVDAGNNKVTADITVLGTYTLAADFPYDDVQVTLTPDSINADGVTTASAETDEIMMNNGQPVADGTLATVSTTLGTIQEADADGNTEGLQLTTAGGTVQFTVVSAPYGGDALVSVRTVEGLAQGSAELELVDTTPPVILTGIQVTAYETTAEVSWDPSQTPDLAEYLVYYREGIPGPPYDGQAGTEGVDSPVPVSGVSTSRTVKGLTKDRPYYFTVAAVDASGNESDIPAGIMVRTAEGAPRPVPLVVVNNLQAGQSIAEVSWMPSPDDLQGAQDVVRYEVHRVNTDTGQDVVLGAVDAGNVIYVDSAANNPGHVIQPGVNYEYYVRTIDVVGNYSDSPTASLFLIGAILDVTDDVATTPLGWELDHDTGALLATIRIENNAGKNGAPLRDAFWYAIAEGSDIRLANPDGSTNGLAYADVTAQVEAQLPNVGDGDMDLDAGESVIFTVAIYTRDRSIPEGHIYGIWADPPIVDNPIEGIHAFDSNADYVIDDFEVLEAVDGWHGGAVDDFGLLEAIELWRAGGYMWDEEQGEFVPQE